MSTANPYIVELHTGREIQLISAAAFSEPGTPQDRHAISLLVNAVNLMRSQDVRCILCDEALKRRPAYVALVTHVRAPGLGTGIICRRCGNRAGRPRLAELAAERAQLVFGAPRGNA